MSEAHPDSLDWLAARFHGDAGKAIVKLVPVNVMKRLPFPPPRGEIGGHAMTFLAHALDYAARGWSILPMTWTHDGRKKPACKWKQYQRRRPSLDDLTKLFKRRGVRGLGVLAGPISGDLCVRDFDDEAAYRTWASKYPNLALILPTVKTKRGYHVYFIANVGRVIHLPDGELRGADFCVLPPSEHPSGATYSWVVPLPAGDLPKLDPVAAGLVPEGKLFDNPDEGHLVQKSTESELNDNGGLPRSTESRGGGVSVVLDKIDLDALDTATIDAITRAVRACLPEGEAQRNRCIFRLARTLKGLPSLAKADPRGLRPILQRWHKEALPAIETKDFTTSWVDFLRGWAKVKFPRGVVMRELLERAKAEPLPAAAQGYDDEGLRILVSVCRELQRKAGNDPFFISARMAGEMLNVGTMTAWRYLFLLESDGVLAVVKRGDKSGKATRFRYLGDAPRDVIAASRTEALIARLDATFMRPSRTHGPSTNELKAKFRRDVEAMRQAERNT